MFAQTIQAFKNRLHDLEMSLNGDATDDDTRSDVLDEIAEIEQMIADGATDWRLTWADGVTRDVVASNEQEARTRGEELMERELIEHGDILLAIPTH